MSFILNNMARITASGNPNGGLHFAYKTTDTIAEVATNDYFAQFGSSLAVDAQISITASDDVQWRRVVTLTPTVDTTLLYKGVAPLHAQLILMRDELLVNGSTTQIIPVTGMLTTDRLVITIRNTNAPGVQVEIVEAAVGQIEMLMTIDPLTGTNITFFQYRLST